MGVISQEKLKTLYDMGFELLSEYDNMIRLIHKEYAFKIDLYHSDARDPWQGVYMHICDIDGIVIKELKGRNVIANARRYVEKQLVKQAVRQHLRYDEDLGLKGKVAGYEVDRENDCLLIKYENGEVWQYRNIDGGADEMLCKLVEGR